MYTQIKNLDGTINTQAISRDIDKAYIPFDPANTDYQEYLRWLEAGNTPIPAEENT
jgi:hypothetical protein